ncbi:MAG: hypothetical protein IPM38_08575 [Ignavibacteria bacterium]|nr:hypothetical protein [Ignavibacteria bacterium]
MQKITLLICFILISSVSYSQLRLDENFDYPAGDSIGAHGWTYFSGVTNTMFVTSPGLSYAGYPLSGIGNAATVNTTGNDYYKNFTSSADSTNTSAIYAFFMVNVQSAQRPGDYFLGLLPDNSTTFYSGRLFARDMGGVLEFGVTKASTSDTNSMVWSSGYSYNTTYLMVLKYEFVPGSNNNLVSLFIFNSGVPATEPAVPTIGPALYTSGDAFNIGRVALRQGVASRMPTVIVDGIRATTAWLTTVVNIKVAIEGILDPNTSTHVTDDTVTVYLRNNFAPYTIVDSAKSVINSQTLTGFFNFRNAATGTYYFDVRFRGQPVYRNAIQTWSKAGGELVTNNDGGSYDFTTSDTQAFGNNTLLKGTVYSIYSGDVSQDNVIDISDGSLIDNDAFNFASGYLNTDLTGDNVVDLSDASIADNNAFNFVGAVIP